MKKFITDIKTLAALFVASAALAACSSDNDLFQPSGKQVYTLAINASKGGDVAKTRALTLDGKTLNATWATSENIYVKKGSTWATGSLNPDADGATATLKGSLRDITIEANDGLMLQFPKSGDITYTGQKGTIADIAANSDYATATVTVASVSATGNITPTDETVKFVNQQAIVKFTLLNSDGSALPSNPTMLTVSDGTNVTTLTDIPAATYTTNGDGVLFVALPGFSSQTVTLTAIVGTAAYIYKKGNVTFTNGQYYEVRVKMAAAASLNITNPEVGQVIGSDGKNYAKDGLPTGVTAVALICYVDGNNGLALAMADEEKAMNWNTAVTVAAAHFPTFIGGTWKLPSLDEWNTMLDGAGGADLHKNGYWSSTECGTDGAYPIILGESGVFGFVGLKEGLAPVRACLAF